METKSVVKSKTAWASVITAALPLIPGVGDAIQAHPQESMGLISAVFFVLRLISGGRISF